MRLPALTASTLAAAALLAGCSSSALPAPDLTGAVWVANEHGNSVTVLDPQTGEVLAALTGVAGPHNLQASATRDVVWVTATGGVVGIDAARLFPTAAAPAGEHPAHVVETAGGQVLVTAAGDDVVRQFDADLSPGDVRAVGDGPHGMRVTADGDLAAVANTTAGSVTLLDPGSGSAGVEVPVGPSPIQVALTEDGSTVYVAVAGTHEVVRVDVASARVTGRVPVPSAPAQLWLTDGGVVLSANQGTEDEPGSTVSVIDGDTMKVTGTLEVGSGPHGVTADPEGTRAWVSNMFDDTVTAIDLTATRVLYTVDVGDYPNGITYSPVRVPDRDAGSVDLILPEAYSSSGHPHGSGAGHDTHDSGTHGSGERGHAGHETPWADVHGSASDEGTGHGH